MHRVTLYDDSKGTRERISQPTVAEDAYFGLLFCVDDVGYPRKGVRGDPRPTRARMTKLERIEAAYRCHHSERRSDDFVFCEPERSELFREWIGTGRRVLDLGCRFGALTKAYVDRNEVVGVDVDREALAEAAKLGIETLWADADEPLPFEDGSFDVVVAGELLEHLRFPEQTIAEVRRVLRPGGVMIGSVPNSYRLKSRLRFLVGHPPEFADDPTHLRMFAGAEVLRLLDGFEEAELRYVAGRLTRVNPRLFANDIVFRARKPGA